MRHECSWSDRRKLLFSPFSVEKQRKWPPIFWFCLVFGGYANGVVAFAETTRMAPMGKQEFMGVVISENVPIFYESTNIKLRSSVKKGREGRSIKGHDISKPMVGMVNLISEMEFGGNGNHARRNIGTDHFRFHLLKRFGLSIKKRSDDHLAKNFKGGRFAKILKAVLNTGAFSGIVVPQLFLSIRPADIVRMVHDENPGRIDVGSQFLPRLMGGQNPLINPNNKGENANDDGRYSKVNAPASGDITRVSDPSLDFQIVFPVFVFLIGCAILVGSGVLIWAYDSAWGFVGILMVGGFLAWSLI